MKRIITVLPVLALLSLASCASGPDFSQMSPAQIQAYQAYQAQQSASMDNFLAQTNSWSQGMQNNSQQVLQNASQGTNATQQANRGWYQKNASGTTVYCQQVGSTVLCR